MSSMTINQNVLSLRTHGQLAQTSSRLEKSIEKLSSGLRINRAADDAAGLAISEKLRRQVRGLSRAILNAQDGVSMIQSAEGALGESQSNLQRMRELAIQASNDTLTSNDRLEIQKEVNQLREDLDRIAYNTDFNTKKLLDGSQTAIISSNSQFVKGLVNSEVVAGDFDVSLALQTAGTSHMVRSQILRNKDTNELASGGETLQSIAQFYDNNGEFVLSSPKTLTINSNGRMTEIKVDGGFTLGYLTNLIDNAMKGGSQLDQANASTVYKSPTDTNDGAYIQIASGIIGTDGKLNFSGDQGLMTSLGLSTVRQASNNIIRGISFDQAGNQNTVQTNDGRLSGLLSGIDVAFESQVAQVAGYKGIETGISIAAGAPITFSITVSGVDGINIATASITLGAGQWTLNGIQRSVQKQIEDQSDNGGTAAWLSGLKAEIVEGELRLSNPPATSDVTSNITISSATANNELGIVDQTKSTSITGSKDKDAVFDGITRYDKDVAAGIVTVNIGDGNSDSTGVITLMTTTSVGTLADMVKIDSITTMIQNAAITNDVSIRADRIGDSLAITNTQVGTAGTVDSIVSITWASAVAGAYANLQDKLGIDTGVTTKAEGTGDSAFRLHIVSNSPQFHIGADQGQTMNVVMGNMDATSLGVNKLDLTSIEGASAAIGKINDALDKISAERSKLGSYQNRLEYAINNLRNMYSNMTSAESRIRDADIAQEMIEFTRDQIVNQSGTAMLAQANLVPQGVLTLLR